MICQYTSSWGDKTPMSIGRNILMRMFGRPEGVLGRLGGVIMASMNRPFAAWVIGLLGVEPHDSVLEVGFGSGTGIELLAKSVSKGYIAGVDASREMTSQAKTRNASPPERPGWKQRRDSACWRSNLDRSQIKPARPFLPTPSFRCDTAPNDYRYMRNLSLQQFALFALNR
jgi:hypothetical protein